MISIPTDLRQPLSRDERQLVRALTWALALRDREGEAVLLDRAVEAFGPDRTAYLRECAYLRG